MKCVPYILTLSFEYHGMEFVLQNFDFLGSVCLKKYA